MLGAVDALVLPLDQIRQHADIALALDRVQAHYFAVTPVQVIAQKEDLLAELFFAACRPEKKLERSRVV